MMVLYKRLNNNDFVKEIRMNFLLPERKTAQIIIPNFMFSQRTESTEGGQPEIKSLHVICSTSIVVFLSDLSPIIVYSCH